MDTLVYALVSWLLEPSPEELLPPPEPVAIVQVHHVKKPLPAPTGLRARVIVEESHDE